MKMRRLCLLIPDIATTKRIADHLKDRGTIPNAHIHIIGKSSLAIDHLHLHKANLFQTTNLPQALLRGGVLGFFVGALLGATLIWLSPFGLVISVTGLLVFILVGIIFGLWISGLIGIGVQNAIVEQATPFIQQGKYLMMLDLKKDQEDNIIAEILERFPQAKLTSATFH
jgi:hypothetical protein